MTTVNHCLDAAKACNVDDLCQKLRTEYVSACIKPTAKSGLCNRPKCNKALRRFFDRVPADYTHELLFCPCTDTACAERRRQTIVPSCSYESTEKLSCITQMRACNADYVCRLEQTNTVIPSHLIQCQPSSYLWRMQHLFLRHLKWTHKHIAVIWSWSTVWFCLMIHLFSPDTSNLQSQFFIISSLFKYPLDTEFRYPHHLDQYCVVLCLLETK